MKVNLSMNNICITGANGFLGSNLVKYFLERDFSVTAVIRAGGNRDNLVGINCDFIEYDGTVNSLQQPLSKDTIVIHTAAYYVAEHKEADLPDLLSSNIQYGLNLLEAMRIKQAKKIINIGTAWQGFNQEKRRPVNLYAATKQTVEDFIAYYCDAEGFSAISLRLNDTYGEKDKRMKLIKLLIQAAITQTPLNMSKGNQRVNLSHISDVCGAISAAINNFPSSNKLKVYNLINDDEYSLQELVKIIESELNINVPVNFGAKAYRDREVMQPMLTPNCDFYQPKVTIREGIQKIYHELQESLKTEGNKP